MSSFCVLHPDGNPQFIVEKLDINLWLLPGIFGASVVYCDIGLKLKPVVRGPGTFEFDLGLPFLVRDPVEDLSPKFYTSSPTARAIANAVFGNSATPKNEHNVTHYDDGSSTIVFPGIDPDKCPITRRSPESNYTIIHMVVPNRATDDESNYVRLRFRVHQSLRLWRWHRVSGRRLFAVSDVRVNEFRENPVMKDAPDFSNQALNIEAVHCLAIFSSKLRVTQVNPQPRYVRVLERSVWETYLGRRVSRRPAEMFVITYWRQVRDEQHPDGVMPEHPFRAYLDVERRGVRFGRWTIALVAIALIFLLVFQIDQRVSVVEHFRLWQSTLWGRITAISVVVALGAIASIYQFKPELDRFPGAYRKVEQRWYRQR